MSRPRNVPSHLKQDVNECHFGLPQLWAVIHLTLSMRVVHERVSGVKMRFDKVNWITAHNEPKWHLFTPGLRWKLWVSTLYHKMRPRKQTTEPKLLTLVSYFFLSWEIASYTDNNLHPHIVGHPVLVLLTLLGLRKGSQCVIFPDRARHPRKINVSNTVGTFGGLRLSPLPTKSWLC